MKNYQEIKDIVLKQEIYITNKSIREKQASVYQITNNERKACFPCHC